MRMAVVFSLLFVSSFGASAQSEMPDLQTALDAQVTQYSVSASGLPDALLKVSRQFHIPMGIEWVRDKEASRGLGRTWNHATVRDIVRSIVKDYPGYDLELDDSIVHVFRQDLLSTTSNFLNLKVPDFFEVHQEPAGLATFRRKIARFE